MVKTWVDESKHSLNNFLSVTMNYSYLVGNPSIESEVMNLKSNRFRRGKEIHCDIKIKLKCENRSQIKLDVGDVYHYSGKRGKQY